MIINRYSTENRIVFGYRNLTILILSTCLAISFVIEDLSIFTLIENPGYGSLTSSTGWFFCLLLTTFFLRELLNLLTVNKNRILLFFYFCLVITAVNLANNELVIRGEFTYLKALKILFYFIMASLCAFVGFQLSRVANGWFIRFIGIVTLVLSAFGFYLDRFSSFDLANVSIFHATPNLLYRDRGFSDEPSSLALTILCSLVLIGFRLNTILTSVILITGLSMVLLLVPSRASAPSVVMALFIVIFSLLFRISRFPNKKRFSILVAVAIIFSSFFLSKLLRLALWETRRQSVSDATRSFWSELSLNSLISFPFGCGLASSLTCVPDLAMEMSSSATLSARGDSIIELRKVIFSYNDFMLIPKTWIAILTIHFGLLGVYAAYRILCQSMNGLFSRQTGISHHLWRLIALTTIVSASLSTSRITAWILFFVFGILIAHSGLKDIDYEGSNELSRNDALTR